MAGPRFFDHFTTPTSIEAKISALTQKGKKQKILVLFWDNVSSFARLSDC